MVNERSKILKIPKIGRVSLEIIKEILYLLCSEMVPARISGFSGFSPEVPDSSVCYCALAPSGLKCPPNLTYQASYGKISQLMVGGA